ncbi:hypothetical protein PGTUg99_032888 [Puccinia graminis f. sp. tritici]|uniref:Uncharacterized protein n=1 Tax=Puccinia graminis f. sp. tritici TaxID=56615 RepID=A0A5B0QRY4_PUCGR|nr:hypothetical protein PGTUg99_032888 [Puccinia graminis f. sp. tritici]
MVYAAVSKRHKNENPVQVDRPAEVHYDGGEIVLGETFRNGLKNFVRKALVECNLETYSLLNDPETKIVINRSLLRLTHQYVARLSDQAKRTQLPQGFVDKKNEEVIKAVNKQITETIKSEKGTLRSCLLCNIHPTSLYKVNGNVPPIYTVFSDASSSSSHNTTSKPKTYVLTRNGRQVQKRLEHGSELFSLDKIPPPCLV